VHLVGFITKKFVTMHGHKNVKKCVVRVRHHASLLTRSVQSIVAVAKDDFINCALRHTHLTGVIARGLCHL